MLGQTTLDWPLSREEKKHRLLQLYDTDLRAADSLLSARSNQDNDERQTITVTPKTFMPGAVEDSHIEEVQSARSLEVGNIVASSARRQSWPACRVGPLGDGRPEKTQGEEAQSSNGGQSARSFEYLTPESVPRTPPGFDGINMPRTVYVQPPPGAPPQMPPLTAVKEGYYCDKTATVIPAIPPMPYCPSRQIPPPIAAKEYYFCDKTATAIPIPPMPPAPRLGDHRRNISAIPPMPTQVLQDIRNLPKRPKSVAADSTRHKDSGESTKRRNSLGESTRRRTCSKETSKWDAFQVLSSARHGKYEEVEMALSAGFGVNFADTHGNTLFHVACQNGRKRIAKLAVKYGARMDAQNAAGNTGLHFLFAYGYPEIADYFISKGAREDIRNEAGKVAREGIR